MYNVFYLYIHIFLEPANKKIKKQNTFFSTMNKVKGSKNTIKRPTQSEISLITSQLNTQSDHDYTC